MYRNFICYRGSSSAGLQVANELFGYLSSKTSDTGQTYFSPINNTGEKRNFLLDPYKYLGNVENFILLLTKDFFSGFIDEFGNINTNSVTMIELDCVLKNTNVKFIPVIFPDFSWEGQIMDTYEKIKAPVLTLGDCIDCFIYNDDVYILLESRFDSLFDFHKRIKDEVSSKIDEINEWDFFDNNDISEEIIALNYHIPQKRIQLLR